MKQPGLDAELAGVPRDPNIKLRIEVALSRHPTGFVPLLTLLCFSAGGACVCPVCGASYSQRRNLKAHMKKHSGKTTCPICLKTLAMVNNMRLHMVSQHGLSKAEVDRMTKKRAYFQNAEAHATVSSAKSVPPAVSSEALQYSEEDPLRISPPPPPVQ